VCVCVWNFVRVCEILCDFLGAGNICEIEVLKG